MTLSSLPVQHRAAIQKIVVAAFIYRRGAVLLARRALTKAIAPGRYHLPGGHVEHGEAPTAALQRELHEEFGISAAVGHPLGTFAYTSSAIHTVGIAFHVDGEKLPDRLSFDPADTAGIVWATEAQMPAYLLPDDHNLTLARTGFQQIKSGRYIQ